MNREEMAQRLIAQRGIAREQIAIGVEDSKIPYLDPTVRDEGMKTIAARLGSVATAHLHIR